MSPDALNKNICILLIGISDSVDKPMINSPSLSEVAGCMCGSYWHVVNSRIPISIMTVYKHRCTADMFMTLKVWNRGYNPVEFNAGIPY